MSLEVTELQGEASVCQGVLNLGKYFQFGRNFQTSQRNIIYDAKRQER
jgi:hypothetical protein